MAAKLSRTYLRNHMVSDARSDDVHAPSAEDFADALIDQILAAAHQQLRDEEESDTIELTLPVTLRAVDRSPQSGCIEVCVDVKLVQVCYHRDFKGDRPGKG